MFSEKLVNIIWKKQFRANFGNITENFKNFNELRVFFIFFFLIFRNFNQLLEENFEKIGEKLWNSEKKSVKGRENFKDTL